MFTVLPEAHSPVVNVASRLRTRAVCAYICTAGVLHERHKDYVFHWHGNNVAVSEMRTGVQEICV